MATLKTKFSVGLFLIVGVAVAVIGVIWLGMSNYFEKGRYFVAYFDESVQGLDKDSPVKYRGVRVGRVQDISVAPDEKLIEVVMKIESEPQAVANDIVAQLKSVGITGLVFIELERKNNSERLIYPPQNFAPPFPVVPTRPSDISKLFKGIEDVFDIFRSLDTRTISEQLIQTLKKINATIDQAQLNTLVADLRKTVVGLQKALQPEKVQQMLASFEQTSGSLSRMAANADGGVTDIRRTVGKLEAVIDAGGGDIQSATADLRQAAGQVRLTMETATALLQNTDRKVDMLQNEVATTLKSIEQAGTTLNRFLDRLAADPSQILFSGPPPEKPSAP